MKKALLLVSLIFSLFACDNRPKDVLSRGKMEDVLYDYHLMQGLIDQLPADERQEKAQSYLEAVFAKHGITEAQFDSSAIYYNRHTKDLHKIYTNLKERYDGANEEIQLVNGNNDMMAIYAEGGDTTNLWNATNLIVLRHKDILNKESFTIHADSSFRHHDQFIFTFVPVFMKESNEDRNTSLSVGLSILYASGKHIGTSRQIAFNGRQQLTLKAADEEDIKQITGFFYYQGKANVRNICLIDDISLVRMHEKETEVVEKADTLATDSVEADTLPKPTERRLTPEEIRQQNRSKEQIKIQTAPSVRTPNKMGPKRRTNTTAPSPQQKK